MLTSPLECGRWEAADLQQEAKLALFCSQFLLFLSEKVKNPKSSRSTRNTVCVTAEWCFLV